MEVGVPFTDDSSHFLCHCPLHDQERNRSRAHCEMSNDRMAAIGVPHKAGGVTVMTPKSVSVGIQQVQSENVCALSEICHHTRRSPTSSLEVVKVLGTCAVNTGGDNRNGDRAYKMRRLCVVDAKRSQEASPRLKRLNFGSISLRYSACLRRRSASCTLPRPLHIRRSVSGKGPVP